MIRTHTVNVGSEGYVNDLVETLASTILQRHVAKGDEAVEYSKLLLSSNLAHNARAQDLVVLQHRLRQNVVGDEAKQRIDKLFLKVTSAAASNKSAPILYVLNELSRQKSASSTVHRMPQPMPAQPQPALLSAANSGALGNYPYVPAASAATAITSAVAIVSSSMVNASASGSSATFGLNTAADVPEEYLLRELLYTLQGVDGPLIAYNQTLDAFAVRKDIGVSVSNRAIVKRVAELGWLYRKVTSYLTDHDGPGAVGNVVSASSGAVSSASAARLVSSGNTAAASQQALVTQAKTVVSMPRVRGLVRQAMEDSIRDDLTAYYQILNDLQAQISAPTRSGLSHALTESTGASSLTLKGLLAWVQGPLERMQTLALMCDAVKDLEGGALISAIVTLTQHGSAAIARHVGKTLSRIVQPLVVHLRQWLCAGELLDPFDEFFIAADSSAAFDRLWTDRFSLRTSMLPSFITISLAQKIMLAGKSVVFVRRACGDAQFAVSVKAEGLESLRAGAEGLQAFNNAVEGAVKAAGTHLLRLLWEKFGFERHCIALKKYLLLGQGDFIHQLVGELGNALARPAASLPGDLTDRVQKIASGANRLEHDDVVSRLKVAPFDRPRLKEDRSSEAAWDIFQLDYHIDAPLNVVFSSESLEKYHTIFKLLWRLKRVEAAMAHVWTLHMAHSVKTKSLRDRRVLALLRRGHLLRHEMSHCINNLSSYMMFEVLECAWTDFVAALRDVTDLDSLIAAHDRYLTFILNNAFLDGAGAVHLMERLQQLLDIAIFFTKLQERVYFHTQLLVQRVEVRSTKQYESRVRKLVESADGKPADTGTSLGSKDWGASVADEAKEAQLDKEAAMTSEELFSKLVAVESDFRKRLNTFLVGLGAPRVGAGALAAMATPGVGAASRRASLGPQQFENFDLDMKQSSKSSLANNVSFLKLRLDFNEFYSMS